jgi:hypothetical protein
VPLTLDINDPASVAAAVNAADDVTVLVNTGDLPAAPASSTSPKPSCATAWRRTSSGQS